MLIDTLNVSENIALSLKAAGLSYSATEITQHLANVGLHAKDGLKKPSELSGGMLRRACLAQIIAQKKKLIILDEPFVGLDTHIVEEIIALLKQLQRESQICFLLISHNVHYAKMMKPDRITELVAAASQNSTDASSSTTAPSPTPQPTSSSDHTATGNKNITTNKAEYERCADQSTSAPRIKQIESRHPRFLFSNRFLMKLTDYLGITLPLIVFAFLAAGLAISMMFANLLHRVDVASFLTSVKELAMFRSLIEKMVDQYMPDVKAKLYAIGLARIFVMELGPLLTALLLAGRIGGSYAGEVATMQSTRQAHLLSTLSINPRTWTLLPSFLAAVIASPILTAVGTGVALWSGCYIGCSPEYIEGHHKGSIHEENDSDGLNNNKGDSIAGYSAGGDEAEDDGYEYDYSDGAHVADGGGSEYGAYADDDVYEYIDDDVVAGDSSFETLGSLPPLFDSSSEYWSQAEDAIFKYGTDSWVTWPPMVNVYRSIAYIIVILLVGELCGRFKRDLDPQHVPKVITWCVVLSSLLIIFMDYGFNKLLLMHL